MGKIKDERARQISIGYALEHDKEKGIGHLLYWSAVYFLKGKFVKGAALFVAGIDTLK